MANLTKASYRILSVLMTTIYLNIGPATANDEQTKQENAAFKEAVQAVKDKNYTNAIALFEEQAKLPRHDAQYNSHFTPPVSTTPTLGYGLKLCFSNNSCVLV